MLTLFTVPKPFAGHIGLIQQNALASWSRLHPACQIVLCGDDPGVAAVAAAHGAEHLAAIDRNAYGTPLLSSAFSQVEAIARHPTICYVNGDILLTGDLIAAVQRIALPVYLMVGQRWDLELGVPINFAQPDWERWLRTEVARRATLHPPQGSDYFVFPKGAFGRLPDFAVGRPGWDNWLIFHCRARGVPVIDATAAVLAVHQNHDYRHIPGTRDGRSWQGPEAAANYALMDSPAQNFSLADATHLLTPHRLRPRRHPRALYRRLRTVPILYPHTLAGRLLRALYRVGRGMVS